MCDRYLNKVGGLRLGLTRMDNLLLDNLAIAICEYSSVCQLYILGMQVLVITSTFVLK